MYFEWQGQKQSSESLIKYGECNRRAYSKIRGVVLKQSGPSGSAKAYEPTGDCASGPPIRGFRAKTYLKPH